MGYPAGTRIERVRSFTKQIDQEMSTIGWFPGHMAKARRQIAEALVTIDVVIEVLDARLPVSSANPLLLELRGNKPCIMILNKQDLADPAVTDAWVRHFEKMVKVRALPMDARQRSETASLLRLCRRLAPHRGKPGKILRTLVVGIPNVGKSTLINTLAGRKMARVGDRPALTTCTQQIDLRNGIHLNDTPGLLWPVMDDQGGAYRLAASGAVGDNAMDQVNVALFLADFLMRRYAAPFMGRFKFSSLPDDASAALEEIGRRRGCLVAGGAVDLHRAAETLLQEFQGGKIGRISLEEPGQES
jgi:ribosome biogenesis GTPase A